MTRLLRRVSLQNGLAAGRYAAIGGRATCGTRTMASVATARFCCVARLPQTTIEHGLAIVIVTETTATPGLTIV